MFGYVAPDYRRLTDRTSHTFDPIDATNSYRAYFLILWLHQYGWYYWSGLHIVNRTSFSWNRYYLTMMLA